MDIELYSFFFITTVMLILVPGPAAITVAKQAVSYNSKLSFLVVFGVASADTLFFILSATGIASLLLASTLVFSIIKWLGVVYLLFLGMSAIFSKAGAINIDSKVTSARPDKAFLQGLLVQLANPKALMYFAALLPQFINKNEPLLLQIFIMGMTCFLADLFVYSMFARMASKFSSNQMRPAVVKFVNKLAGLALIATAVRMVNVGRN